MTALMGLDARMRMARLWWRAEVPVRGGDLAGLAERVLAGGVDVVQLRAAGLDAEEEAAALAVLRRVAEPTQALVVADGAPEVAGRAHADALLVAADRPAAAARSCLHRWAHVGRTVRSEAELDAALADPDVDYLAVPIAPTGAGTDLGLVRYAARQAPQADLDAKPWWAAGDIGPDTVEAVLASGACRVMVGGALSDAADPEHAAEALRAQISGAWRDPAMRRYLTGAAAGMSSLVRG